MIQILYLPNTLILILSILTFSIINFSSAEADPETFLGGGGAHTPEFFYGYLFV